MCRRKLEGHALEVGKARYGGNHGGEVDVVGKDVAVGEVAEVLEGGAGGGARVVDEEAGGLLFEVVVWVMLALHAWL